METFITVPLDLTKTLRLLHLSVTVASKVWSICLSSGSLSLVTNIKRTCRKLLLEIMQIGRQVCVANWLALNNGLLCCEA